MNILRNNISSDHQEVDQHECFFYFKAWKIESWAYKDFKIRCPFSTHIFNYSYKKGELKLTDPVRVILEGISSKSLIFTF